MLITAVRERVCSGCAAPVHERTARWCGRCGEPLTAATTTAPVERTPVRWRRVALAAVAAVVVAGLVAAAGPIVDRLPSADSLAEQEVASPGADALERVGRRYLPPAAPVNEPVCLRAPGDECLLWHIDDKPFMRSTIAVAGDTVVLAEPAGPKLRGVGLRTGEELWVEQAPGSDQVVTATDDLVLSIERWADERATDRRLVVRDADDGSTRFYLDGFTRDGWLHAKQVGDRLLVLADGSADMVEVEGEVTEGDEGEAAEAPHNLTLLGVDARTGEVVWRTSARGTAGLASDGTSVVLEAGELVARDVDGQERWRTAPDVPDLGGGWIHGGVVHVWRTDGRPDLLIRLADGEQYPFGGGVIAVDGPRTLLHAWDTTPSGAQTSQRLVLLRDGEPVWEIPQTTGCFDQVTFEPGVVRTVDCDGRIVDRDVIDGRELTTGNSIVDPRPDPWANGERIAPYALRPEEIDDARTAFVLVDLRTDAELVRLPPNASPVYTEGPDGWSADAGGVLLIQHNGGLTAIDLPSEDAGPTAMLRTFAR